MKQFTFSDYKQIEETKECRNAEHAVFSGACWNDCLKNGISFTLVYDAATRPMSFNMDSKRVSSCDDIQF